MSRLAFAVVLGLAFHDVGPGCGKRNAHPEPPPAPVDAPIDNEAVIRRYSDEIKLDPQEATIEWKGAETKRSAGKGELVAVLTAGNSVIRLARSGDYVLVSFGDPSQPKRRLMAWISGNAFERDKDPGLPVMPKKCANALDCKDGECDAVVSTARSGLEGYLACRTTLSAD